MRLAASNAGGQSGAGRQRPESGAKDLPAQQLTTLKRNKKSLNSSNLLPATPENAVGSLLQIAENALKVSHLATTAVYTPRPSAHVTRVRAFMKAKGYDAAPVRDSPPRRYVALSDMDNATGAIAEIAKPIGLSQLVTADLPLADAVKSLRAADFYFVLAGTELVGIVTRSDLQRPAVSMVLLALIIAAEPGLDILIVRWFGDQWLSRLESAQRRRVEAAYRQRVKANAEISMLECLTLADRLSISIGNEASTDSFGRVVGSPFEEWSARLKRLRNRLAHGGGLLDAERDPTAAIELFSQVRAFSEEVWRLARLRSG